MKYIFLLISLCIAIDAQLNDTVYLKNIYSKLSKIYKRHVSKRHNILDPAHWESWIRPINFFPHAPVETHYDFIIVGSGSAGSVLANRLSEIHDWNILLLEAGTAENMWSLVPLTAPTMPFTPYNWNYLAEYQPGMSAGLRHHRMHWPGGRALGGSTVINHMIYARGNRYDFDHWGAAGNPGWSYSDVLPYFIKSEHAKMSFVNPAYHGLNGWWSVEHPYHSTLAHTFIDAGRELGLPHIDYHVDPLGVSTIQANLINGRRHTVASAFLRPIIHRHNLHIVTSAFVTNILIDPETRQAYGVVYETDNLRYTVEATKEVILSAGAIRSPQLLMLAGIGPRHLLEELDIPVLEDLPVGLTLQDHLMFPGLAYLIDQDLSLSTSHFLDPINVVHYLANGTGPFASLGGIEGIGYIKSPLSEELDDIPDIELLFTDGSLNTDYGLFNRRWMNIHDDVYNDLFAPTHTMPSWSIFPMVLHPRSVGHLTLGSRDPHVHPLLYGNYFTDPEDHDINTMLYAVRYIQKLAATHAFQRCGSRLNPNRIPGCDLYEFDTDDYWRCAIRAISVTYHHQVGTVRMGPPEDPMSVVNHELKVYGIDRLRVADCSVIPFAIGAHTSAVAVMIGEKAADMIKESWLHYMTDHHHHHNHHHHLNHHHYNHHHYNHHHYNHHHYNHHHYNHHHYNHHHYNHHHHGLSDIIY